MYYHCECTTLCRACAQEKELDRRDAISDMEGEMMKMMQAMEAMVNGEEHKVHSLERCEGQCVDVRACVRVHVSAIACASAFM